MKHGEISSKSNITMLTIATNACKPQLAVRPYEKLVSSWAFPPQDQFPPAGSPPVLCSGNPAAVTKGIIKSLHPISRKALSTGDRKKKVSFASFSLRLKKRMSAVGPRTDGLIWKTIHRIATITVNISQRHVEYSTEVFQNSDNESITNCFYTHKNVGTKVDISLNKIEQQNTQTL